jgi:hypothetical protein
MNEPAKKRTKQNGFVFHFWSVLLLYRHHNPNFCKKKQFAIATTATLGGGFVEKDV